MQRRGISQIHVIKSRRFLGLSLDSRHPRTGQDSFILTTCSRRPRRLRRSPSSPTRQRSTHSNVLSLTLSASSSNSTQEARYAVVLVDSLESAMEQSAVAGGYSPWRGREGCALLARLVAGPCCSTAAGRTATLRSKTCITLQNPDQELTTSCDLGAECRPDPEATSPRPITQLRRPSLSPPRRICQRRR